MSILAPAQHIHRRKSSKDDNETTLLISPPEDSELTFSDITVNGRTHASTTIGPPPPPRNRISLGPPPVGQTRRGHTRSISNVGPLLTPPSASPKRASFAFPQTNGGGPSPLPSPFRLNFAPNGHLPPPRTRSISAYSPSLPSPLAMGNGQSGFPPSAALPSSTTLPNMNTGPHIPPQIVTSYSNPENGHINGTASVPSSPLPNGMSNGPASATTAAQHKRRHSRMHSRNLSVFFPRPGSIPATTISEDSDISEDVVAPVAYIPSAGLSVSVPGARQFSNSRRGSNPPLTPLGQGFKFGGKPPPSSDSDFPSEMDDSEDSSPGLSGNSFSNPARRGHHHKHSLSHNFFSFLEPVSTVRDQMDDLHTQPTPVPQSPWAPISAFPQTAKVTVSDNISPVKPAADYSDGVPVHVAIIGAAQFLLGAWLWVCGQQIGSLSCTGLGYWVVFDAFGLGVGRVAPAWLARPLAATAGVKGEMKRKIRRPYGNGRMETVLMFAQAVYLMFSSVYICKETVEHLLLSAGGQEGHHHHSGDEVPHIGIDFPIVMIFLTFFSLLSTAFFFENNSQLVNLSGNRLPSLNSLISSLLSKRQSPLPETPPTDPLAIVLTNPFVACPLFVSACILFIGLGLSPSQHRSVDLGLSCVIAVLTFNIAYRASVVLGTVLLQTSPPKGMPSGKLESFHRAVREIERHPHVSHLPAPHIWQLTPSLTSQAASALRARPSKSSAVSALSSNSPSFASDQLVVTMELHVRPDLGDDDVLALTKWTWERCVQALGGYKEFRDIGEVGGPEISVGVVKG